MIDDPDPRWRIYEQSVRTLIQAMDQATAVLHDTTLPGTLSGIKRQVDVLVRGRIETSDKIVVVECKKYDRRVTITAVDQFVGALLDLGADKGFLYSYSGFSAGALARADGAQSPEVIAVEFSDDHRHGTPLVLDSTGAAGPSALLIEELDVETFRELISMK